MTSAHDPSAAGAGRRCGCPPCAAADAMVTGFARAMGEAPDDVAPDAAITALMGLHRFVLDAAGGHEAQSRLAAMLVMDLMRVAEDRGLGIVEEVPGDGDVGGAGVARPTLQ